MFGETVRVTAPPISPPSANFMARNMPSCALLEPLLGESGRMVRVELALERVTDLYPAKRSKISKLWFVVVPQVPLCSPVPGFSLAKFVVKVLAMCFSYAAISSQDGL